MAPAETTYTYSTIQNRTKRTPLKMVRQRNSSKVIKKLSSLSLRHALLDIRYCMEPFSAPIKYATSKSQMQTRKT